MGQGGAQASEDAASIAAILPLGTGAEGIPGRLQLWQGFRRPRVNIIQDFTRRNGRSPDNPENPRPTRKSILTVSVIGFC